MEHERIDIAKAKLVRRENDILGNYTLMKGEYKIPGSNKTAFYKVNGDFDKNDVREKLASEILEALSVPHAIIDLTYDSRNGKGGCISYNILEKNEELVFCDHFSVKRQYTVPNFIRDLVEHEKVQFPQITETMAKRREKYLAQIVYAYCIMDNNDLKNDNFPLVRNKDTGEFRCAQAYDFGQAFIKERKWRGDLTSGEVMKELLRNYYPEIKSFVHTINTRLTPEKIEELTNKPEYIEEFGSELGKIKEGLKANVQTSKKLEMEAEREPITQILTVEQVHERTKGCPRTLKEKVSDIWNKFTKKEQML